MIIKELIKHENKFNRKVFHDRENSENQFSGFSYSMKCFKKYIMNISRKFTQWDYREIRISWNALKEIFHSVFSLLGKYVLKICSKFTGEHQWRSVVSIKLQNKFIEIALRQGCSPVNLLHISRTPFPKNTSEVLLLTLSILISSKQQFKPKIQHILHYPKDTAAKHFIIRTKLVKLSYLAGSFDQNNIYFHMICLLPTY